MNIKLDNAISDITGKTGMAIINAILKGVRDPFELANLVDPRCKSSKETIAASLEGTWDEALLFELDNHLHLYNTHDDLIKGCDEKLRQMTEAHIASAPHIEDTEKIERAKKAKNKKTSLGWDVELAVFQFWGTNVKTMPGFSDISVLHLMSELGRDWVTKFPTKSIFVPGLICLQILR